MTVYTFNGVNYDSANLAGGNGFGYSQDTVTGTGVTAPLYIAPMIDALADMSKVMRTTSTSSVSIGTGSKSFTMASSLPFMPGAYVLISATASPTAQWMFGQVTACVGTSLTVNVVSIVGSGTVASWNIQLSGPQGVTGPSGILTTVVNVEDFGAVADGVTDCYTAISNAVAVSAGKTLFFPSIGTYMISQAINVTGSNINIIGVGRENTIIKRTTNNTGNAILNISGNKVSIFDLQVDGNANNSNACNGIVLASTTLIATLQDVAAVNCKYSSGYGAGIVVVGGSSTAQRYSFHRLYMTGNDKEGFYAQDIDNFVMSDIKSESNGGDGVVLNNYDTSVTQKIYRGTVTNVIARANSGSGLVCGNFNEDNIPANYLYGNTNPEGSYLVFNNIVAKDNLGYGVYFSGRYIDASGIVADSNGGSSTGYGGVLFNAKYSKLSCVSTNNSYYGIDCGGAEYSKVYSSLIQLNGVSLDGIGLNCGGTVQVDISSCTISDNGSASTGRQVVVNNVETDANGRGFPFLTQKLVIRGCKITLASSQKGILLLDGVTGAKIVGNDFEVPTSSEAAVRNCIINLGLNNVIKDNMLNSDAAITTNVTANGEVFVADILDFCRLVYVSTTTIGHLRTYADSYTGYAASSSSSGVAWVNITNGGTGYSGTPFAVTFTGGGGSGATGTAYTRGGVIIGVRMTNFGSGYTSAPTPVFTAGGGSSAAGTAQWKIPPADGKVITTYNTHSASFTFTAAGSPAVVESSGGNVTSGVKNMVEFIAYNGQWLLKDKQG